MQPPIPPPRPNLVPRGPADIALQQNLDELEQKIGQFLDQFRETQERATATGQPFQMAGQNVLVFPANDPRVSDTLRAVEGVVDTFRQAQERLRQQIHYVSAPSLVAPATTPAVSPAPAPGSIAGNVSAPSLGAPGAGAGLAPTPAPGSVAEQLSADMQARLGAARRQGEREAEQMRAEMAREEAQEARRLLRDRARAEQEVARQRQGSVATAAGALGERAAAGMARGRDAAAAAREEEPGVLATRMRRGTLREQVADEDFSRGLDLERQRQRARALSSYARSAAGEGQTAAQAGARAEIEGRGRTRAMEQAAAQAEAAATRARSRPGQQEVRRQAEARRRIQEAQEERARAEAIAQHGRLAVAIKETSGRLGDFGRVVGGAVGIAGGVLGIATRLGSAASPQAAGTLAGSAKLAEARMGKEWLPAMDTLSATLQQTSGAYRTAMDRMSPTGRGMVTAAGGAAIGAGIGMMIPLPGATLIGAGIGATIGYLSGSSTRDTRGILQSWEGMPESRAYGGGAEAYQRIQLAGLNVSPLDAAIRVEQMKNQTGLLERIERNTRMAGDNPPAWR